jgi:hypothetical protein
MYIASILTVIGAVWFYRSQRRPAPEDDSGDGTVSADDTASADAPVSDDAAVSSEATVSSEEAMPEPSGDAGEPRDSEQTAS